MWDIGVVLGLAEEGGSQCRDGRSMFLGEGKDQLPEAHAGGAVGVVLHHLHRKPRHTLHNSLRELWGVADRLELSNSIKL